jgi:hypothetical protein
MKYSLSNCQWYCGLLGYETKEGSWDGFNDCQLDALEYSCDQQSHYKQGGKRKDSLWPSQEVR